MMTGSNTFYNLQLGYAGSDPIINTAFQILNPRFNICIPSTCSVEDTQNLFDGLNQLL